MGGLLAFFSFIVMFILAKILLSKYFQIFCCIYENNIKKIFFNIFLFSKNIYNKKKVEA